MFSLINHYIWIGKTRFVRKNKVWYNDVTEKEVTNQKLVEELEYRFYRSI